MLLVIEGIPQAKVRHRSVRRGNYIATYDPQEALKNHVKTQLACQVLEWSEAQTQKLTETSFTGEYYVNLWFGMPIPKSFSKTQKNEAEWGFITPSKNDLDNLAKFVFDCGNGVLWLDDRTIIAMKAYKYYTKTPKTVIEVIARKKTLEDEVKSILGIYGSDELISLIEDTFELYELYDVDEKEDWVRTQVGDSSLREIRLARTAYLLSRLADNHADLLKKVSKCAPAFHKKAEAIAIPKERKVSGEGKTLC